MRNRPSLMPTGQLEMFFSLQTWRLSPSQVRFIADIGVKCARFVSIIHVDQSSNIGTIAEYPPAIVRDSTAHICL